MQKILCAAAIAVLMTAPILATETFAADAQTPAATAKTPGENAASMLEWTPDELSTNFRQVEKLFPVNTVKRGDHVRDLPQGAALGPITFTHDGKAFSTESFMDANRVSGLLILKDGKIVLERYGLGRTAHDRWTSFSVAKSITSLLVGAAIKDGYISGTDAMVTTYLPELKGSAYDGVSVGNILTMTSGVKWNEDYSDPNSDVSRFITYVPKDPTIDPQIAFMATLPREAAPGTKFVYKTGESNLIGALVQRAVHKSLADYLSEKIWQPAGMEQDAVWMIDSHGLEIGGCCISMTLRDYGRVGLLALDKGVIDGKPVLADGYFEKATTTRVKSDWANYGYGYQWWIDPDGSFQAIGIYGQMIFVSPKENLVIVLNSAWPKADMDDHYALRDAFVAAARKVADGNGQSGTGK